MELKLNTKKTNFNIVCFEICNLINRSQARFLKEIYIYENFVNAEIFLTALTITD